MARLREGEPAPSAWAPPPVLRRRRRVAFEWVKVERGASLFWDEHGNLYDDERLRDPNGLVIVRLRTVVDE